MDQFDKYCDPPQLVFASDDVDLKAKERLWKQNVGQDYSSCNDDRTTDDSKLLRMHQGCLQGTNKQRGVHCCELKDSSLNRNAKKDDCLILRDERRPILRGLVNSCLALYAGSPGHTSNICGRLLRKGPQRPCWGCPLRTGLSRWRLLIGTVLLLYLLITGLIEEDGAAGEEEETKDDELSLRDWVLQHESSLRNEYHERAATAHEACKRHGVYATPERHLTGPPDNSDLDYQHWLALKRVNWEYLYHVPKHHFLYCKVPKSGSSTWVVNLLKLAGIPEQDLDTDIGLHKMIRDYYPRLTSRQRPQFRQNLRLLVVRHPFDRILSAYRDKLQNLQRDLEYRNGYYNRMYGRDIVRVHRDPSDASLANMTEPTWPEFVSYLLATEPDRYDEHWRPIHMLCSPCVMRYTVIAKMETFSEDSQFVINELGLEEELSVEWRHPSGSDSSDATAELYYSQLTVDQIDALSQKYSLDFELFDYDPEDHRNMAKPD